MLGMWKILQIAATPQVLEGNLPLECEGVMHARDAGQNKGIQVHCIHFTLSNVLVIVNLKYTERRGKNLHTPTFEDKYY